MSIQRFPNQIDHELRQKAQCAADALASLEPWQAEKIAALVLGAADSPLPAFLGGMDDSRHWTSKATHTEIECYALACFEAMNPARQSAFLGFVQGRAAA